MHPTLLLFDQVKLLMNEILTAVRSEKFKHDDHWIDENGIGGYVCLGSEYKQAEESTDSLRIETTLSSSDVKDSISVEFRAWDRDPARKNYLMSSSTFCYIVDSGKWLVWHMNSHRNGEKDWLVELATRLEINARDQKENPNALEHIAKFAEGMFAQGV